MCSDPARTTCTAQESFSMANLKRAALIFSTKAKKAARINWSERKCFPKCTQRVRPKGSRRGL